MVDHAIVPRSSMIRAGVPRTRSRARFSRIATTRSVDAELAVGTALHMHHALSARGEDRLASGEIHNSEHADPRDLRSGQDGHPDRRVAGAMQPSSRARSTYMQPSRRESHRPLRSMPPSLCYAGKDKVQRARRRAPAASLRPCGPRRPARPAAGTATISTRASDRKTACRDESGLMATPPGCG